MQTTKDPRVLAFGTLTAADSELSELIGGLYDAGLGDTDWRDVLAGMAARIGGEGVTLNHSGRAGEPDALVHVGVDPAFLSPYNAYYRHLNPFLAGLRTLPVDDAISIDPMLISRRDLERTEYYNDFLAPHGLDSLLSLATVDDAGQSVYLGIWRSRRRPAWGEAEMWLLRHLKPHLRRALSLQGRIAVRHANSAGVALSRRERECLAWLARGATSKVVARSLGLSVLTVDGYVAAAMAKLGAATRAQAVARAIASGLITL